MLYSLHCIMDGVKKESTLTTYRFVAFTDSKMRRNYKCPNKDNDPMLNLISMIADLNHDDRWFDYLVIRPGSIMDDGNFNIWSMINGSAIVKFSSLAISSAKLYYVEQKYIPFSTIKLRCTVLNKNTFHSVQSSYVVLCWTKVHSIQYNQVTLYYVEQKYIPFSTIKLRCMMLKFKWCEMRKALNVSFIM